MPEPVGWRAIQGPANYLELINEFLKTLDEEISVIRATGGDQKQVFKNGEFLIKSVEFYVYRFPLEVDVYIDDDTPVDVLVGRDKIEGYIVASAEDSIDIAIKDDLGEQVKQVTVVNNLSKILEALKTRYQEILSGAHIYNENGCMKLFGFREPAPCEFIGRHCLVQDLNSEQRTAVDKSLLQEITFIWGPPGTGKTRTLSVILNNLIKNYKSVLLVSHTNLAVDEALKKFAEDPDNRPLIDEGRVIRYGTLANPDPLLKDFLIDTIIEKKSLGLNDNIDQINVRIDEYQSKIEGFKRLLESREYHELLETREDKEKQIEFKGKLDLEVRALKDKIGKLDLEIARQEGAINDSKKGILNYIGYLFSDVTPQKLATAQQSRGKLLEDLAILEERIDETTKTIGELTDIIVGIKRRLYESMNFDSIADIEDASRKISEYMNTIEGLKSDRGDVENRIAKLRDEIFENALVIGCTLTKSYMDPKIFKRRFDIMILDEASMATLPSVFFVSGLTSQHIISGDFRQLAPIAKSNGVLADKWLKRDLFYQSGIINSIENNLNDTRLVMLKEQYRMHPDIAALINYRMYKGQLTTSLKTKNVKMKITQLPPFENHALVLCDTSTINPWCSYTHSNSRINLYSAMLAVKITEKAIENSVKSIGIITPYRSQAKLIDDLLEERKVPKKVAHASTIHKFQGNQKEYVIIDLVEGGLQNDNVGRLLREYSIDSSTSRLMNVAISRAQGKVILLANYQYFTSKLKPSNMVFDVLKNIKEKGIVVDSGVILSSYYGISNIKSTGGRNTVSPDDTMMQFNEVSFYKIFTNDIQNAKSRIVIFSPFITKNRMRKLFNYLKDAVDRGVDVYLIVRGPKADAKDSDELIGLIGEIRKSNIHVIIASEQLGINSEFHEKLGLIDKRVLYYGSLNILSQSTSSESMLAFTNKKTIEDIIKNLDVDNILRRYNSTIKQPKKSLKALAIDDFSKEMANAQYIAGIGSLNKSNYADAIKYLSEATKINPNASIYYCYLGIALCKNGQHAEALDELNTAVELSPDNSKYLKVAKTIEDMVLSKNTVSS